jgi:hypothetical protein
LLDQLSGFQNWHIQNLNNAHGTVVNMDYFPVTINQLPAGYTAESLLEHIRTNINSFTNDDAYFQPYPGLSGESALWDSPNPLGSILTIDLTPHDGSVITTANDNNKWIFSVIRSPLDTHHPVSGNREFGFTINPNGSYTFYTKGVDRLTQSIFADIAYLASLANFDLMAQADNLWESFQNEIKKFVDRKGGSSTVPTIRNQGDRPDWEKVEEFLKGKININQLRNDC